MGASQTLTSSIDTSDLSVGHAHAVRDGGDYWGDQVGESDEANNVRSVTFTVTAPVLPDLVVASITPAATSVVQGAMLDFSFMVENTADSRPTGLSWAGFQVDGEPDPLDVAGFNAGRVAGGRRHADAEQQHRHVDPQRRHPIRSTSWPTTRERSGRRERQKPTTCGR